MRIKALEKEPQRESVEEETKPRKRVSRAPRLHTPRTEKPQEPVKTRGAHQEVILVRCNAPLYETIRNMISASHTAQDFTFTSVTDFIRSALEAYRDGMELTELDETGAKTTTTVRVDRATKQFHASLPDRLRSRLAERAIRTFLKRQMEQPR